MRATELGRLCFASKVFCQKNIPLEAYTIQWLFRRENTFLYNGTLESATGVCNSMVVFFVVLFENDRFSSITCTKSWGKQCLFSNFECAITYFLYDTYSMIVRIEILYYLHMGCGYQQKSKTLECMNYVNGNEKVKWKRSFLLESIKLNTKRQENHEIFPPDTQCEKNRTTMRVSCVKSGNKCDLVNSLRQEKWIWQWKSWIKKLPFTCFHLPSFWSDIKKKNQKD